MNGGLSIIDGYELTSKFYTMIVAFKQSNLNIDLSLTLLF